MNNSGIRRAVVIVLSIILIISVIGAALYIATRPKPTIAPPQKPIRIGLSMDTLKTERWRTDRDLIIKRAGELGAVVTTFIANGDDDIQREQIENLIVQKVDVIVVIPHDASVLTDMIESAHKAGIKVIAYDRLIKSPYTDLYISFDNKKVGELEADGIVSVAPRGRYVYLGGAPTDNNSKYLREGSMAVLEGFLRSGSIRIVFDKAIDDWDSEEAYASLKGFLKEGGRMDAVIAANDAIAYGAIRALKEFGLSGKVPVSGQDAELAACQRIIDGTQTVTVFKPIRSIAYKTAEIAVSMAGGKPAETNAVVEDVPSLLLDPILVDKANMDSTVIASGFHSREEIYRAQ